MLWSMRLCSNSVGLSFVTSYATICSSSSGPPRPAISGAAAAPPPHSIAYPMDTRGKSSCAVPHPHPLMHTAPGPACNLPYPNLPCCALAYPSTHRVPIRLPAVLAKPQQPPLVHHQAAAAAESQGAGAICHGVGGVRLPGTQRGGGVPHLQVACKA